MLPWQSYNNLMILFFPRELIYQKRRLGLPWVKYFGVFGWLEHVQGTRDFIFHYRLNGTNVRIWVSSKTRSPHTKAITMLSTKVMAKFMVDSSQPGISAGFLFSMRPLRQPIDIITFPRHPPFRQMGDVKEKDRSVLMSNMPLKINDFFERQIVQTFVHTIVKGALWEQQRRCAQTSRREAWLLDPDHE